VCVSSDDDDDDDNVLFCFYLFLHSDGKMRRIPPGWNFPLCTLAVLWEHWCSGDEVKNLSPLRRLDITDVQLVKRGGRTLSDVKFLMGKIEDEARRRGVWKDSMTREEVKKVYEKCFKAVVITATNNGRTRSVATLKWHTIIRAMPKDQRVPRR
jgi:hypothetical protein